YGTADRAESARPLFPCAFAKLGDTAGRVRVAAGLFRKDFKVINRLLPTPESSRAASQDAARCRVRRTNDSRIGRWRTRLRQCYCRGTRGHRVAHAAVPAPVSRYRTACLCFNTVHADTFGTA